MSSNDKTVIMKARKPKFAIVSVRGLGDIGDRIREDVRDRGFAFGRLLRWKPEGRSLLAKIDINHWKDRSATVVGLTFRPVKES